MKAALLEKQWEIPKDATDEQLTEYAKRVAAEFTYGSNMRRKCGVQTAPCGGSASQRDALNFR